jgi:2-polyprenyl-3-methyl-5-hydroxy-6-metoxy-1,4-benzoquinol methylase
LSGAPAPRLAVRGVARDYGARLSRARWRRGLSASGVTILDPGSDTDAAAAFAASREWVLLLDDAAILRDASRVRAAPGKIRVAADVAPASASVVHTLRELEGDAGAAAPTSGQAIALCFSTDDPAPRPGERVGDYVARLVADRARQESGAGFAAFAVPDASAEDRPELAAFVPAGARRLLDVGCGSGGFAAARKRERPGLMVVGVEIDPSAAARARASLDSVLALDAREAIRALAAQGERFDVLVLADVLEHLEDPGAVLRAAHAVAAQGATLIASVPNGRHLSIVRDLLHGRFDPVAAGLLDAGHRRWFDGASLTALLAASGWSVRNLQALPGSPAADAGAFKNWCAGFPGADPEGLAAYQWVGVAGEAW